MTELRTGAELEMIPGTFKITAESEDGSYETEFQSVDGLIVHQWLNPDDSVYIEKFNYGTNGTVTNWYEWGANKEIIVQFDQGKIGYQVGYYSNLQPKFQRFWDGQNDHQISF